MRPSTRAVFIDDSDGGHEGAYFNGPLPKRMVAVGRRRGPQRRLVVGHRVDLRRHGHVLVAVVRAHRPSGVVRLRVGVARLRLREGADVVHLDLAAAAALVSAPRLVGLLRGFELGALSWRWDRWHGSGRRRFEGLP